MVNTEPALRIPLLVGCSRDGRKSIHVARFVIEGLQDREDTSSGLEDLAEYNLPIMQQRASELGDTVPRLREFCGLMAQADGVLIVTPEYKGGIPGVLKNALDYLDAGIFRRRPIGIVTVSAGGFGGISCLAQLRLVCLAMGGLPIPTTFPVSQVDEAFDEKGQPRDQRLVGKRDSFLGEFLWYVRSVAGQRRIDDAAGGS